MTENKQKVWLTIRGNLNSEEIDGEKTEFLTEGAFYRDGTTHCLSYQESEVSGMGDTMTTLRLDNDKVSVIRLGEINSVMEFEKGKRNMNLYSTPYGDISMGIFTREIDVAYNEEETPTRVLVNYDIEIKGLANGTNTIDIAISNTPA